MLKVGNRVSTISAGNGPPRVLTGVITEVRDSARSFKYAIRIDPECEYRKSVVYRTEKETTLLADDAEVAAEYRKSVEENDRLRAELIRRGYSVQAVRWSGEAVNIPTVSPVFSTERRIFKIETKRVDI